MPLCIWSTAINVLASVCGTAILSQFPPGMSLIGPVLGTTIALVTCHRWWYPLLFCRSFDASLSSLLAACVKPCLPAVPLAAIVLWAAH